MKKLSLLISLLYGTTMLSGCTSTQTESRNWTVEPVQTVHHGTNRPDGFYRLGRYYQGQNRTDQAIAAYRKALAIDPEFSEAHNALGTIYALQGKYDGALAEFNLALAATPNSAHIYNNIGYLNFLQGRYAEAATAFRQATALDPSNKKAWNNLGMALAKIDDPVKSNQAFAKAIEVTPPSTQSPATGTTNNIAASAGAEQTAPVILAVPKNRGVIDYTPVNTQAQANPGASDTGASPAAALAEQASPQPFAVIEKPNLSAMPVVMVNGVPLTGTEVAATQPQAPEAKPLPVATNFVHAESSPRAVAMEARAAPHDVATVRSSRGEPKPSLAKAAQASDAGSPSAVKDRHFGLEVSNGNGVKHMAAEVSVLLSSRGLPKASLSNKRPFNQTRTVIHYRKGYLFEAARLSRKLEDIQHPAMISENRHLSPRTDVKLVLGKDVARKLAAIEKARSTKLAAR